MVIRGLPSGSGSGGRTRPRLPLLKSYRSFIVLPRTPHARGLRQDVWKLSEYSRHAMCRSLRADGWPHPSRALQIVARPGRIRIRHGDGARIVEGRNRLGHSDAVLAEVGPGFSLFVPLEADHSSVRTSCAYVKGGGTLPGEFQFHIGRPVRQPHVGILL